MTTSPAIPKPTVREAYDAIMDHFTKTDSQLSKVGTRCTYRRDKVSSSPFRCAVGVLIPDEAYVPHMDNAGTVHGLVRQFASTFKGWEDDYELMNALVTFQNYHDESWELDEFLSKMTAYGEQKGWVEL